MPKLAKELSALEVKRLESRDGRGRMAAVGGVKGLYLQILPKGGRTWILRTVVGDRRRDIGLGGYPTVTLEQARAKAREKRDAIERGIDPVEERKAARSALVAARKRGLTFAEAFDKYDTAKLADLKDRKGVRGMINQHAVPHIGNMLVQDITPQDVLRVLQPIWSEKAETARKLRSRLEAVLSFATVAGHRQGDNPARFRGNLRELLPKQAGQVVNQPAVSLADAPSFFAALAKRDGMGALALRFAILTAARSGEVRGATWDEIDMDAKLWVVPASRMKMAREWRVPLTDAAVALLDALPRGNPLVFPAVRGGALSDMTLSATMRRMHEAEVAAGRKGYIDKESGRPAVPHGWRSTFRTFIQDRTDYPRELAEAALAHVVGGVEGAYARGSMLQKRRAMMADWSQFLGA